MQKTFMHTTIASAVLFVLNFAYAQESTQSEQLEAIEISADASPDGLSKEFAGGQVAAGSRVGILGNKANLENPYSTTNYTNAQNTLKVGDWTRVDVGARYIVMLGNTPVTLRARIDNLANKKYWESVGGYPGQGYLISGAPRTFSFNASFDF
ncbi:TPA: TonB-dependent receptor [Haemophilus influenzae]|uniref:TonB-dependent receptor n=1 Tax=Haemophilus influenzae TaxID=727 RepID=UPI000DD48734|nr:TonB-dependent receptor [Haemophilus influenzae]